MVQFVVTNWTILSAIQTLQQQMAQIGTSLTKRMDAMSGSMHQQFQDLMAALKADFDALDADLSTLMNKQVGEALTQADVDALASLKASADALKSKADAAVAPPAPPAPTP